ncbi:MAG: hypothetical protein NTY64_12730 [Deltaproteobacteria bacterium]|nr:hypothetical protein [Deltaproteobacteria bacterium]
MVYATSYNTCSINHDNIQAQNESALSTESEKTARAARRSAKPHGTGTAGNDHRKDDHRAGFQKANGSEEIWPLLSMDKKSKWKDDYGKPLEGSGRFIPKGHQ